MRFKYITDKPADGKMIRNNPSGRANARTFFTDIKRKGKFEFMPDTGDRSTFFKVIVESMSGNNKGTGFSLREMNNEDLPGYYEVTGVRLRVVE